MPRSRYGWKELLLRGTPVEVNYRELKSDEELKKLREEAAKDGKAVDPADLKKGYVPTKPAESDYVHEGDDPGLNYRPAPASSPGSG